MIAGKRACVSVWGSDERDILNHRSSVYRPQGSNQISYVSEDDHRPNTGVTHGRMDKIKNLGNTAVDKTGSSIKALKKGGITFGKKVGSGLESTIEAGSEYKDWLSSDNLGESGARKTAKYNMLSIGAGLVNTIWSFIASALKASLTGLFGMISYGFGAILSAIHACLTAWRTHKARKRYQSASTYSDTARDQVTSRMKNNPRDLDRGDERAYQQAKADLEAWRKNHEREAGMGREGVDGASRDMRFYSAMEYFKKKTKRKGQRSAVESASYIAAAGGGVALGVGGLLAGAGLLTLLASNPIGWGIAATLAFSGTIYLIGSAIYKGIRRWKKARQGKISGAKRKFFAKELHELAGQGYRPAIQFLQDVGVIIGSNGKGKFAEMDLKDNEKKREMLTMIERKFSSWY